MRRVIWGALAIIAIVTLSQVGSWLWEELKSDPLDRYEVIEVVSYKGTSNHAVVFNYHNANSSAAAIAVWLINGDRPAIGSKFRPRGEPVLDWFGAPSSLQLKHRPKQEPLFTAEIASTTSIWKITNVKSCFLEYGGQDGRVCYNPEMIVLTSH